MAVHGGASMHRNSGTADPGSYLGGAVTRYIDSGAQIAADCSWH
jgi:hypothetical protein